jgi:XRE family transcriptional regulator, aerobic/anaerobic benzoate catabolism transcriptional regulator
MLPKKNAPTEDPGKIQVADGYLRMVGERVRDLRATRGITRRVLARDSGVSERYLALLESGQANPTITVIRALAKAFDIAPTALIVDRHISPLAGSIIATVRTLDAEQLLRLQQIMRSTFSPNELTLRGRRIALVGLRGAGKTTVGTLLAKRLEVPFVELDKEIERDAGVPLSEIFEVYGQAGFRRLERASFERILDSESGFVLATGGSIVSEALTFDRVLTECFTVWLTATPAEHMERVVAQGDMRPMAGNPDAMDDLRRILAGREAFYRRADVEVSSSHRSAIQTVDAILGHIPPAN